MSWIEEHAEFYRVYLADDRSLAPLARAVVAAIAASLSLYLVSLFDPAPSGAALAAAHNAGGDSRAACSWTSCEPAAGR
ncbi:hypothetical protein DFR50_10756 [Roseiarcus fermentans]|uniref:Uncharacterized protein n=1 Tax=Roseiarcus fermentans TaxID=1473586 RepID=A0A366FNS4_9HYPH|nr:hypothetical protein [Roseiarcus fermentans]RBP15786.1 hypothetical protein DFR50_10756 [Roseiarcus fermentans]